MRCPQCGAPSEVSDSRERRDGTRRRSRLCFNGHAFGTLETPLQMTHQRAVDMLARITKHFKDRV